MRLQFICFFTLIVLLAKSQDTVVVRTQQELVNIAPSTRFIEDQAGELTIENILQPGVANGFRPLTKTHINFGVTPSAFWIEAKIRNETDEKLLIEIGNNSITHISVFEVLGNRIIKQYQSGSWLLFDKRQVKNVSYLFPLSVERNQVSTLYIRVKHPRGTAFPLRAGTLTEFYHNDTGRNLLEGIYYGFMLLMILYNLFIYFSLKDPAYLYYVNYVFFMGLLNAAINGFAFRHIYPNMPWINQYDDIIAALAGTAGVLFAAQFLNTQKNAPLFHKIFIGLIVIYVVDIGLIASGNFLAGLLVLEINSLLLVLSFFGAAYQTLRNGYKPAKFFLIAWSCLLISVIIFIFNNLNILPYSTYADHSLQVGSAIEALLLSMALANRINVYKNEKRRAELETLRSLEENKRLITEQNVLLENKVTERTAELKKAYNELAATLQNLKEMQSQLVQKEKMASLGELTAGVAHEIQNPLNFINNFSEVTNELLEEMEVAMARGDQREINTLVYSIKENLSKINHHGKRADAIVKNMLLHSRAIASKKEPTDINLLADEYLRLSYHGLRAKDKSFNASFTSKFDESIGKIDIVPQDIGRVLLNLFNNAFYSVNEKKKLTGTFEPLVHVSTKRTGDNVVVSVRDNGVGISQKVLDKIYHPFFTTKPTGEGTGLGLSMSYDIVTKGHGGELKVETEEGQFTDFKIILPAHSK